jgi:peptide/nickel transport system substrate-binding protein
MPRDSNAKTPSRRRFLQATGTVALASAVAGCGDGGDGGTTTTASGGDGDGTDGDGTDGDGMDGDGTDGDGTDGDGTDGEDGDGTDGEDYQPPSSYPYGAGETRVQEAQQVMEEAGYGPDNRYELDWVQYTSPSWKEMANTIRARLSSAYVDMSISEATFSELLNTTEKGNHEAYTLGWIMDYPRPQNFVQLFDPPNTVYDNPDVAPNGARLFWSEDAKVDPAITEFQTQQFDRITNNPDLSDEATQIRGEAAVAMEEGNWDAAGLIPIYHRFDESFWYDRVDYTPAGGAGGSRSKESRSVSAINEGDQTLQGTSATFNSLDPIASGNTASGGKIMNMFDAPFNYVNGTTEVANLLVDDFTASDDLTEYEFTLKEGIEFHGDWGEVTADDMVYSIQRLVESGNSTNTYFPISVLSISHQKRAVQTNEDDEVTDEMVVDSDSTGDIPEGYEIAGVVDGSTQVEKTGDYSFSITLDGAFAYTTEVLCYSAFSVVPEGIVGDVEGYDGEMAYEEFSTSNPVGTGPFVFETWESGDGGEFSATTNEDYFDGVANFDGMHDAIITDPDASYNYALNQNADIFGIPTSKYDPGKVNVQEEISGGRVLGEYGPLENGLTVNYGGVASINTFYVGFNMEEVPKAVREAMALVINQDQFVQSVFKGRGEPAYHLQPPAIFHNGASNYRDHYQG